MSEYDLDETLAESEVCRGWLGSALCEGCGECFD